MRELSRKAQERGLTPEVLAMVQHSPLGAVLGRDRMFFNLEQAVARYQAA